MKGTIIVFYLLVAILGAITPNIAPEKSRAPTIPSYDAVMQQGTTLPPVSYSKYLQGHEEERVGTSRVVVAGNDNFEEEEEEVEEGGYNYNYKYRELKNGVGSRPPMCKNKCEGCRPCDAVQNPANSVSNQKNVRVRLHYANYEPEGWKCKCRSAFFNP